MRYLVFTSLSLALAACGGGGSSTTDETTGDEVIEDGPVSESNEDEAPDEEPAEEPAARGPGRVRIVNQVGGQEAGGNVRVMNGGEVVAEGSSGDTLTVEAGTYTVVGEITDDDVLIDTPTNEADGPVTVVAGEEQTVNVEHPISRVRIRVTRRGRAVARWRLEVRPQSNPEAEPLTLNPSQRHVPVTPGRYDGTLHVGNEQITVNGIIFQGGATMDVPVNVD
jgi:hypothetical protein